MTENEPTRHCFCVSVKALQLHSAVEMKEGGRFPKSRRWDLRIGRVPHPSAGGRVVHIRTNRECGCLRSRLWNLGASLRNTVEEFDPRAALAAGLP